MVKIQQDTIMELAMQEVWIQNIIRLEHGLKIGGQNDVINWILVGEFVVKIYLQNIAFITEFPSGKAHSFRGGMKARQDAECQ